MNAQWRRASWGGVPVAIALFGLVAVAQAAEAQGVAEQLAACKNEAGAAQSRVEACGRAISEAKDNDDLRIEALLQRGVLYESSGDRDAAIKDYSEVIKIDSSSSVAYFNRGNVYDQMGQHD